jgi:outer membrane protein assembly factor BamE (lipoprotein component of BamABCDE complex)
MLRPLKPALFVIAFCALGVTGLSACAPITTLNGFQVVDVKPQDAKVGVDTRSTILSSLGSPSAVSTFDKDTWYYITQLSDRVAYFRPVLKSRTVVAITFDHATEKVTKVRTLGLTDGYQIAYETRETPTRGRELSVIEQLLGTIGRGGSLPPENDPGQRPR